MMCRGNYSRSRMCLSSVDLPDEFTSCGEDDVNNCIESQSGPILLRVDVPLVRLS